MSTVEDSLNHFFDALEIDLGKHYFGDFPDFTGSNHEQVDTSYIDLTEDFTFFFVYEKENKDNVVLFNSLDIDRRGFLLGSNNANGLYFLYYRDQETPIFYNFNVRLADKNCVIVSQVNGELSISLYNFNNRTLLNETSSFDEEGFEHSDEWYVGGNAPGYLEFDVQNLTGKVDHLLFVEGYLNPLPRREIVRAFFTEVSTIDDPRILSEENVAGQNWVTSQEAQVTGIEQLEDYTDGGEEVATFEWVEHEEAVDQGDPILVDTGEVIPANGPLVPEKKVLRNDVAPNAGTFITSQTLEFKENIIINEQQLFSQGDITENVTIRSVAPEIQENSVVIPDEETSFIEDGDYIQEFGFNNLLFIGDHDEEDNIEYIVFEDQVGVENVNLVGQFSGSFGGFGLTEFDTEEEDSFNFLNGLILSEDEYEKVSNFFIRNGFDIADRLSFDILEGDRGQLVIDDNFDQLPVNGNDYYLNGQKLVEDQDFFIDYDEFVPEEEYEDWQGLIVFTPGTEGNSKVGDFDLETDEFPRGSTIAFLNGHRNIDFIEHSKVDLLSESFILNKNKTLLLDQGIWDAN